ncbi:MAG: hypothetical protein WAV56_00275 [Microgenomates group bacterium]
MSSRLPRLLRLAPLLLVSIHLAVIVLGGYFLSPEFTVYPFLASKGFLPYTNLIDQHFPALLFGPLAMPAWLTSHPHPLLALFLTTIALTDLFLYLALRRAKSTHPLFWLLVWISLSLWFSGNTLWFETFITLFFSLILFLQSSSKPVSLARGFLFGLILLIKPTLFPALLLLFFLTGSISLPPFFTGLLLPFLVTVLYLIKLDLLIPFFDLTVRFNRDYYLSSAGKIPTARQILEVAAVTLPGLSLIFLRRRFLAVLIIFATTILAYPRFEYVHLLPSLFLLTHFLSQLKLRLSWPLIFLVLVLILLSAVRAIRHPFGNFYLTEETKEVTRYLQTQPGTSLYLLGGSDLLYPLTNRVPPSFTYLPSLPWYLTNPTFSHRVVSALLTSPATTVLVRSSATVDGVNIQESSGPIWNFINSNYHQTATVGSYGVYQRKGYENRD